MNTVPNFLATKKPDRGDPEEYATFLRQVKELTSAQSNTHTRRNSKKRGQGSSSGENNGNGDGNNGNGQGNGAVVDVETGKKTRPGMYYVIFYGLTMITMSKLFF